MHLLWPERFPYPGGRLYVPIETGDPTALADVLSGNGLDGALLVQPSSYAFENGPMRDLMALEPGRYRSIGQYAAASTGEAEIRRAQAEGFVGARINLYSFDAGFFDDPHAADFIAACRRTDFITEVFATSKQWPALAPKVRDSFGPTIIEHFGFPDCTEGVDQPGFQAVLDLARRQDIHVKLSCAYRFSKQDFPHDDVLPFARMIVEAFGVGRCLWGSDWPFLLPERGTSVAREMELLERWVERPADRETILADNPRRLFGFA